MDNHIILNDFPIKVKDCVNTIYKLHEEKIREYLPQIAEKLSCEDVNTLSNYDDNLLHIASKVNDVSSAKKLIKKGININQRNNDGNTPLITATDSASMDIVKLLINTNAEIDIKNHNGETALFRAVCEKNYHKSEHNDIAYLLLENRADADTHDNEYTYALHHCVQHRPEELSIKFVEHGANVNSSDAIDFTPLHYACENHENNLAKYLIENGADVSAKEEQKGDTPLHLAAQSNNKDVIQLLIDNGANIEEENDWGATPLMTTIYYEDARNDNVEALIEFIKQGADIKTINGEEDSLLDVAAKFGFTDSLKELLKILDVHELEYKGNTLLHHCVSGYSNKDILKFLVEDKKLSITAKNDEGKTPIDIAIENNLEDYVSYLEHRSLKDITPILKTKKNKARM